jgi:hypothetical protein
MRVCARSIAAARTPHPATRGWNHGGARVTIAPVHSLSRRKKIVIASAPAAAGTLAVCLTYLLVANLPLLLLVYFAVCAGASQFMTTLWADAVMRRIAEVGDRPDGAAQQFMLAGQRQRETVLWYAKLSGACVVAWALLLATA